MYKDWKNIPIPPKMQSLEKDDRGYPIPIIVLRGDGNKPVFSANNIMVVAACMTKRLCSICGKPLGNDIWFVGGAKSAFHPEGVYLDPPVHQECGHYALQVCPYLAIPNFVHRVTTEKVHEKASNLLLAIDSTVDPNRPVFFAFVRTTNYSLLSNGKLLPVRPYIGVEYWNNGAPIQRTEAKELSKHLNLSF